MIENKPEVLKKSKRHPAAGNETRRDEVRRLTLHPIRVIRGQFLPTFSNKSNFGEGLVNNVLLSINLPQQNHLC